MTPTPAREFWIKEVYTAPFESLLEVFTSNPTAAIHVIEKSAYDALKSQLDQVMRERDELKKCEFAWEQTRREIARLESWLAKGRYSIEQEAAALEKERDQLKAERDELRSKLSPDETPYAKKATPYAITLKNELTAWRAEAERLVTALEQTKVSSAKSGYRKINCWTVASEALTAHEQFKKQMEGK